VSANVSPVPPGMRADTPRQTSFKPSQEQIVLLITILLLVVFGATLPGFASIANLLNLMRSISILGILSLGMGLIVISRGIDLSEVAIMAGSWCVALIEVQKGLPVFWAPLIDLAIAIAIGVANGVMVAFVEAPALFVTLAAGFVIYGIAFWAAPAWVVYAPKDAPALAVSRCRACLWYSGADPRLCGRRDCHAPVPGANLHRTLHLQPGR
jgi:ribose transport system permease protein